MSHTQYSKDNQMPRDTRIEKIFDKAARYALSEWTQDFSGLNDLVQDLWIWYMERPSAREKLAEVRDFEAVNLVKRHAIKILSEHSAADNKWYGYNHYDEVNVRHALEGKGSNPYLAEILPEAFKQLESANDSYAESIRSRYEDGVVPVSRSKDQVKLSRAVKSLTEKVNTIAITAAASLKASDGPGSKKEVFPVPLRDGEDAESRRRRGEHSDPTATIAIMLLDNPIQDGVNIRDEYLREEPITEYLKGPRRA